MGASNSAVETTVRRARLVFNLALWLDVLSWWSTVWLAAAAVALVVVKVAGVARWIEPWHVLATGLPIVAGALLQAMRSSYDRDTVAAWLDLKGQCGGTVIAGISGEAVTPRPPGIMPSIRPLEMLGRVAIPVVLLVASFLVPWAPARASTGASAAIERKARVVEQRIERAERLGILDEEEARELMETLEKAQMEAGRSPESAAEAVDQVQRKLEDALLSEAESQRASLQASHDLHEMAGDPAASDAARAESLARALEGLPAPEDLPPELQEALEQMREEMNEKGMDGQGEGQGGKETPDASQIGQLDPETLEKLGKALENVHAQKLEKLGNASDLMTDGKATEVLEAMAGDCGCEGGDGEGVPALSAADNPGKGGPSRGPGKAPLGFGDETDTSSMRFEPKPFDPSDGFAPGLVAASETKPGASQPPPEFGDPGRTGSGVLEGEGGAMTGVQLGPWHEQVVSNYFKAEGDSQ